MRTLIFAIASMLIGFSLLYSNWMAAFGWLFMINSLLIVFATMLIDRDKLEYRNLILLLSFFMCLIPIIIFAFAMPTVVNSIQSTKANVDNVIGKEKVDVSLNSGYFYKETHQALKPANRNIPKPEERDQGYDVDHDADNDANKPQGKDSSS